MHMCRWAKKGLFWELITLGERHVICQKVLEFYLEKALKSHVNVFRYSLPTLRKYSLYVKLC